MKSFILFYILINTLQVSESQIIFKVTNVTNIDISEDSSYSCDLRGELSSFSECGLDINGDSDTMRDQLHILIGYVVWSITPSKPINLNTFVEDQLTQLPFNERFLVTYDFIEKGKLVNTNLIKQRSYPGKIKKGRIIIEYTSQPKSIVIYFDELKVKWKKNSDKRARKA
jgi:hypothetical protein